MEKEKENDHPLNQVIGLFDDIPDLTDEEHEEWKKLFNLFKTEKWKELFKK